MLEVKEIVFGIEKCRTIKKEKHVVRLIIGKYGKNGDAIETVVVKEPRIRKKRELPSITEVLYMAIAVLGFALSLASFLYCTGIEYVSFDWNIIADEAYL